MKNLFVPYELAVKLKALGLDESCIAGYRDYNGIKLMTKVSNNTFPIIDNLGYGKYCHQNKHVVKAPLWQQAFEFVCRLISEAGVDPKGELTVTFEDGDFCIRRLSWIDYEGYAVDQLTDSSEESLMFLINKLEKKN